MRSHLNRSSTGAWRLAFPLVALATAASCSFVLDYSTTQCETPQDCIEAFGVGDAACVDSLCVISTPTGSGGSGGSVGGCVSNEQCVEDNDQLPFMCRNPGEACVSLLSDSCTRVFGDFTDENAIVMGYMGPFDGPFKFIGDDQIPILEMFESEIDTFAQGGLPGGPNGARRPIVIVACDESQAAEESVNHLVDDIEVPIIVGPTFSTPLLDLAAKIVETGTFVLSPTASSPLLLDIQDEGLIWTVDPNTVDIIPAFATTFPDTEQAARLDQAVPMGTDIKVVHTVSGDSVTQSTAGLITAALSFNGKSAFDNGTNYRRLDYGDPTETTVDYAPLIVEILSELPNIVILQGQAEIYQDIMAPVEDNWPMGTPKPYWATFEKQIPQLEEIAEMYADTLLRLRGIRYFRDFGHPNYQAFAIRYQSAHPMGISPPVFQERMYDALYLAAYAATAIGTTGNTNLTGSQFAQALPLLDDGGQAINVGPDSFQDGLNLLQTDNAGMGFVGTTGPVQFDDLTGSTKGTYEIWCMNQQFEFQSAGLTINEDGVVEGTFDCTPPPAN
jgi:branched-chain amino acid transport system substrate-binding protein